ncbi:hypothetical protein VTL71DRAFT_2478 [Oculimacula yallundae]|uniref:Uncharacterized protein n=1 Tax=Oculimacula yallundae TaxID=86028 RepID=A0ABR4CA71_9HELO
MVSQASTTFCFLSLLSSSVSALALSSFPAEATVLQNILPKLAFPTPTPAPNYHELRRRQEAQRTLLLGPDATCGYFGGNASELPLHLIFLISTSQPIEYHTSPQPWGCTASSTCAFATPTIQVLDTTTTTVPGSVLCCDSASGCPTKPGPTSCVDKAGSDAKTACSGSCLEDERVLKCTSGIYIFCNTIAFPTPSLSALFCNYISNGSPIPAETTFSGQGGRLFTPSTQALPSSTASSITSLSSLSVVETNSATSTSEIVAPTASAEVVKEAKDKKKSNTGAIAGGVVGGIIGLMVAAAVVFFLVRWRGSKKGGVVGDRGEGKSEEGDDIQNSAAKRGDTGAISNKEQDKVEEKLEKEKGGKVEVKVNQA